MKRYGEYIEPYLGAFALGPPLVLTEVTGKIILPKLMSVIINNGVTQRNVQYIPSVGGLMVLTTLVMVIGGIEGAYFPVRAAVSFTSDLRADLFSKMQGFSFKNVDAYSTGSLVTRLTNDIQQIQNVLMMGLRVAMHAPGVFIGTLLVVFIMNARLAVVILVIILLLTAAIAIILKTAFPRFTIMQKKLDQLNSDIQGALTNVQVIKSFVREELEEDKFRVMNQDLKDGNLGAMKIVIVATPAMTLTMNIATLTIVWCEGNIIIAGDIPVGDLTAFTTYIAQILISLMMLSMIFPQLSRAVASTRRVSEVMDTEIDLIDQRTAKKNLAVLTGRAEFKHVSFSYADNQDEMVLEDINFTTEPGQMIGIIGTVGSGKTTLVQIIPRLYDVTRGQVLMDGMNVRGYSLEDLREGVGMVLQKNALFPGTIEKNLRQRKEGASMDGIREMAQNAQAGSFVTSFASDYGTDVGQGGVNASDDQRQRLCIARALLKRPKILVLDDSTSAVNTTIEARIRQYSNTSLKDTTKIIIAQCIGSMEEVDRILMLDEGRLIGQGTHERPMEECQACQEIYYPQRDRKETTAS